MSDLSWDIFGQLPGDCHLNFEKLCRSIIRRNYSNYGSFRGTANQPGVEFHLQLNRACSLGDPSQWFGWQCRWYDLPPGRALGQTRRKKILDAIRISQEVLPGLTDWVLWTRHSLTKSDEHWYFGIQSSMKLIHWSSTEVEELLSGPGELLRGCYFGELVLTPEILASHHGMALARIQRRWIPDVHQLGDTESEIHSILGFPSAWSCIVDAKQTLNSCIAAIRSALGTIEPSLKAATKELLQDAHLRVADLAAISDWLEQGDFESIKAMASVYAMPCLEHARLLRRLRASRHMAALYATNILAELYAVHWMLLEIEAALHTRTIGVTGDAGFGKTHLAASITMANQERPAGILLYGSDLGAKSSLNAFANRVTIHGKPVETFEALLAAMDAAGQRVGRRLPLVIDGLNEAEDPRDWVQLLSPLPRMLEDYPYVVLVCTLRGSFVAEALPDTFNQLELDEFPLVDFDAISEAYFQYYCINPTDARLPRRLLRHPLTLRIFCEVTNPGRAPMADVGRMPTSLTALFERHLAEASRRICELSPRERRFCEVDVRSALGTLGSLLWRDSARSVDIDRLRQELNDDKAPWSQSMVRAFEQEGILLRKTGNGVGKPGVSIVYDMLAGHIVADSILQEVSHQALQTCLQAPVFIAKLTREDSDRHPLSEDIFHALVGLVPRRFPRRQLWMFLNEPMRTKALYKVIELEGSLFDDASVSSLCELLPRMLAGRLETFDRLWDVRSAIEHPLNAYFIDYMLRSMTMADRDIHWGEWLRRNAEEVIGDIENLEEQWCSRNDRSAKDALNAHWLMWTLTSTVRPLRDRATRALVQFGSGAPELLFDMSMSSLGINDPYVPERMLAASYGVVMRYWSAPDGERVRDALPKLAGVLTEQMFVPGAPHGTRHTLIRDYALGIITLTRKVSPGCITRDKQDHLNPPFSPLPDPFPSPNEMGESDVEDGQYAIRMDFGNYTIGSLIPSRNNYDDKHPEYRKLRRQIENRIGELGYRKDAFKALDEQIASRAFGRRILDIGQTDRYGKKYSWIAYFEMYGLRQDGRLLSEWSQDMRTPDVDIDPSFPEQPRVWIPMLPDPFTSSPVSPLEWLSDGAVPEYGHLLMCESVDKQLGPWTLLDGFVEQTAKADNRRVFTFLRGILVAKRHKSKLVAAFEMAAHPGGSNIPNAHSDYYAFAGEISWCRHFGADLRKRNGQAKPHLAEAFSSFRGGVEIPGVRVEIPVHEYHWEGHHSELNPSSCVVVPSPSICEYSELHSVHAEWDLYDVEGKVASLYREWGAHSEPAKLSLSYLRTDLLTKYLVQTKQELVWLMWGEREFAFERVSPREFEVLRAQRDRFAEIHRGVRDFGQQS
mgnify:CR=1 FL=1